VGIPFWRNCAETSSIAGSGSRTTTSSFLQTFEEPPGHARDEPSRAARPARGRYARRTAGRRRISSAQYDSHDGVRAAYSFVRAARGLSLFFDGLNAAMVGVVGAVTVDLGRSALRSKRDVFSAACCCGLLATRLVSEPVLDGMGNSPSRVGKIPCLRFRRHGDLAADS